jgi:hypothetical protein
MNKYTKNMFKLKLRISFVKKKVAWLVSTRDLVELIRGAPMSMYSNSDFQEF